MNPAFEAWWGGQAGVLAYQQRLAAEPEQDLPNDDLEHDQQA